MRGVWLITHAHYLSYFSFTVRINPSRIMIRLLKFYKYVYTCTVNIIILVGIRNSDQMVTTPKDELTLRAIEYKLTTHENDLTIWS